MRPGEAKSRASALRVDGTMAEEYRIRRLAEYAINGDGGLTTLASLAGSFQVFVPGKDFAAQLVVEQQIREQIA